MHYSGGHLGETRPYVILEGGGGGSAPRGDSPMRYSGGHFVESLPCVIVGGTSGRLAHAL